MTEAKYKLPEFLDGILTQAEYSAWLVRTAYAHVQRDRRRGNAAAKSAKYKTVIHEVVQRSGGVDAYTGEQLDWDLVSRYDNRESGSPAYKVRFALLLSVDHTGDGLSPTDFRICAWRTNDAKNDLSLDEFIELCQSFEAQRNIVRGVSSLRRDC